MPVHNKGQSEFTYPVPMVQEVQLEGLVSERKVAETGSTHQMRTLSGESQLLGMTTRS